MAWKSNEYAHVAESLIRAVFLYTVLLKAQNFFEILIFEQFKKRYFRTI